MNSKQTIEVNDDVLKGLLIASHYFEGVLISTTDQSLAENTSRYLAVDTLGIISIEHGAALRFLISDAKCYTSSYALFRLQYEALVKAMWTFYIASDEQLELIVGDLSTERADENGKKLPPISKMLKQLEDAKTPAHHTILQLIQFKDISWNALNSYVHSGLHAVKRSMSGYPKELTFTVIRQSNNLMYMSAYLLAIITGNPSVIEAVSHARKRFIDCMQL